MATTKLWKITSNVNQVLEYAKDDEKTDLENVLGYARNDDKTEHELFVSGINCNPDTVYEEMKNTKIRFNKTNGILAFHGYQSFKPGEITPELAHEVGMKLANEMWGDKYEVLVTTHLDKKHIHNHFVINSVSFIDGSKYNSCKAATAELRYVNDLICEEYGLSVIKEKMNSRSRINFNNFINENKKANYYQIVKNEIDLAITESVSFFDFEKLLDQMGYEHYIRYGKLTVRRYDYKKSVRLERQYGSEYSIDNINKRIIETEHSNDLLIEEKLRKQYKIIPNKKYHGFIGLYRYYCYLLKVYPHNIRKYNLTYSMRNDIERFEELNKETIYLVNNNINSKDDLLKNRENLISKKISLINERERLWTEYRKEPNIDLEIKLKEIKKKLEETKEKIKITYKIEIRVENINNNLEEYNKKNEKELISSEPIK